jgi:hypothetical protein
VSLQIDNNWKVQPGTNGMTRLQSRVPFWEESTDRLAFNSHSECKTPDSISHDEKAFADAFRKRSQTPHFFRLLTKDGSARCVSNTSNSSEHKGDTEFLQCYLPDVNVLFAGDVSREAEATKMITSIKSERPCTPAH